MQYEKSNTCVTYVFRQFTQIKLNNTCVNGTWDCKLSHELYCRHNFDVCSNGKMSFSLFIICKNYRPLLTSLQNSLKFEAKQHSTIAAIHTKLILNIKQSVYRFHKTFNPLTRKFLFLK